MNQRVDITGKRYGRLVAQRYIGNKRWELLCDCGKLHTSTYANLLSGFVSSCGCLRKETAHVRTHGYSRTPTYESWCKMKYRCYNPKSDNYEFYGGRGITVCERWRTSFESFLADMGERPAGTVIDRIDPNGNYEPGNCRWAPNREGKTRRSVVWEGKTIQQIADELGLKYHTVAARIRKHGNPLTK